MVKIEINGQVVEAHEGDMLIDVADGANIPIPRFCYHKKLSIAASCRMCLVEVEGAPKAVPSCATPVTDGMKVYTQSKKAVAAQQSVMEFLLINHPLDCPICDQGGECELQDVAMTYGSDVSKYTEEKRIVGDKNIGSLIATDMTRCIHCTRCVRFGDEIGGVMELGATGRSEWMSIGTYVNNSVTSELSGNMIDLCPVGALTSKPFRYSARPWELRAHHSIAPHDSIGSNIVIHAKNNVVKRVVPAENESVNEIWLSDRDRFSYEGINSQDRLTEPMIKVDGQWQTVDWTTALDFTAANLKTYLTRPDEVAILASETSTLEELYLLKTMAAKLGVTNLESRLKQTDFSLDGNIAKKLQTSLQDVEKYDSVLLVGSFLRKELPLLNLRLRKAQQAGCEVFTVNPAQFDFNYDISISVDAFDFVSELACIAKSVLEKAGHAASWAKDLVVTSKHQEIASKLKAAKNGHIFVGQISQQHPSYKQLVKLSQIIADNTDVTVHVLPLQANTVGSEMIGFSDTGKHLQQILSGGIKAFINFGIEPSQDILLASEKAFTSANFIVNFSSFVTEEIKANANVLLPMATFAETAGTYVNISGVKQSFRMAVDPKGNAKAGWKILRVLGNLLGTDFEYVCTNDVLSAVSLETKISDLSKIVINLDALSSADIKVHSLYQSDGLVRRSPSLQATPDANCAIIKA